MRIKKTFREIFPDVDFPVLAIRPGSIPRHVGRDNLGYVVHW